MAKVFVSFLGLTNYHSIIYEGTTRETRFVQSAILEKMGEKFFDRICIVATPESQRMNWESLYEELTLYAEDSQIRCVHIKGELQKEQWSWFSTVLDLIDEGDEVWFDLTHGFRAFSIILSAAVGFIQRTKNIILRSVFYGVYDIAEHPIIDMKDFFIINEWADSVARLTDEADARKLADLAKSTEVEALSALGDEQLINAFNEMTDCIKSIDINNIANKVNDALSYVENRRKTCQGPAKLLLDLVWRKFNSFTLNYPPSGYYDIPYLKTQLLIIDVLLEHRLYMQAFTAMREWIGSVGMAGLKGKYSKILSTSEGRKMRRRFAEVFLQMLQYPRESWDFSDRENDKNILLPWYEELEHCGVIAKLKDIVEKREERRSLIDYRNGFDHAWTSQKETAEDIPEKGVGFGVSLNEILKMLEGIVLT